MAKVQLFATYRDAAGIREFDADARTVGELLEYISLRYPPLYREVCDSGGAVRPLVKVLVNGRHIQFLDGFMTPLAPDDIVSLFPPIAGG